MVRIVNINQAKSQLSALVEQAAAGEEIVIAKAGKPKARMIPLVPKNRVAGTLTPTLSRNAGEGGTRGTSRGRVREPVAESRTNGHSVKKRRVRKLGGWAGQVWISDDFDAPLPPDILAGFLGHGTT